VTLSQSPLAGTIVDVGTHTITITGTDAAGNIRTVTTTFTVNVGGFNFTMSVSPATVKRDWTTAKAWLHHELTAR